MSVQGCSPALLCLAVACCLCAGELEYRKAAFARLQELKIRMDRAVKRASIVERELDGIK